MSGRKGAAVVLIPDELGFTVQPSVIALWAWTASSATRAFIFSSDGARSGTIRDQGVNARQVTESAGIACNGVVLHEKNGFRVAR
jgi:hypothetical protein